MENAGPSRLLAAEASHSGRVRSNNEDLPYCDAERGVFMVIDGVGGHAAGEVAAWIARDLILARLDRQTGTAAERVREAITLANNAIYERAQERIEWRGMGCVLTLAVVEGGKVVIGHVGDTRLYQWRDGCFEKVTHDHSPIGEMEDSGRITEIEAMRHQRRNEVFRDLGAEWREPDTESFIEIIERPFEAGDALLLCSDGLTDLVTAAQIRLVIEQAPDDPDRIVRRLIAAANEAGGKDNVTVVYVKRVAAPDATPAVPPAVAQAASARDSAWTASTQTASTQQLSAPGRTQIIHLRAQQEADSQQRRLLMRSLDDTEFSPMARGPAWFVSRWAMLVYGLALGLIPASVAMALRNHRTAEIEQPVAQAAPQYRNLTVGAGRQYRTITSALEEARTGEVVEVFPGEYPERVTLKDGVTLIGQRPREAVILAPALAGAAAQSEEIVAVVARGIKGARLVGFRVAGDAQRPLDVGALVINSEIELTDNQIVGARRSGVVIEGALSSATLRANLIRANPGAGATIREQASSRLLNNVVIENGAGLTAGLANRASASATEVRAGIELINQPQVVLAGNIFAANRAGAIAGLDRGRRQAAERQNFFLRSLSQFGAAETQQSASSSAIQR